jgi:Dolichyl-phosphate-mannose-protein mannosyltransferase
MRLWTPGRLWAVGALLATAVALPAVWWQALHEDEVVTVNVAPLPFDEIVDLIFVRKGGAPTHFFLEHVFLAWPGGVEGLRLPSLAFFLLALPAAGLVADRLTCPPAALVLVPVLALAPLAVNMATFGRMYSLFLATTLWATFLALVAAERGRPLLWGLAGAALGLLVYVHPIAPLYLGIALLSALVHGWSGFSSTVRRAWPAPVAAVAVGLPFYIHSLSVLRDRYAVNRGGERLATESGDTVPSLALQALTSGGSPGQIAFLLVAVGGIAALLRSRPRTGVVLALWVVVPIAFFTLVPAEKTVFFPRYLLPALPFALLAVVAAAVSLFRSRLGLPGKVAATLVVISLLASAAYADVDRLRTLSSFELRTLTAAIEPHRDDGVLFSSVEAQHVDRYVALEVEGLHRVESRCPQLVPFLEDSSARKRGIWVLTGPDEVVARGSELLRRRDDVEVRRIGSSIVLVISSEASSPRGLIELALDLRAMWFGGEESKQAMLVALHETLAVKGECPTP